jgi:Flp pilus assembly pilin Flp
MTFYRHSAIPLIAEFKCQRGHAMFASLAKLLRNKGGATAIEYAMIASLVSIAGFVFISSIGSSVSASFANVANAL